MNQSRSNSAADQAAEQAAEWFARLQGEDVAPETWLEFEQWVDDPVNAAAYAWFEELWVVLDEGAHDAEAQTATTTTTPAPRRARPAHPTVRRMTRRGWMSLGGALAAGLAVAVVGVSMRPPAPPADLYGTDAGEVRSIALADGTKIRLNGASSLKVALDHGARRVEMADAEATFDVAHDPQRPFLISVGDSQVRVVGTEFNLSHHDGETSLTVRRGVVEVRPVDAPRATPVRLTIGQQLTRHDGDAHSIVSQVEPDTAFAWTQGQLIYRDAPLSKVAVDLSRRLKHEVRLGDAETGRLRFTGVLVVDDEDAVVRRLEGYLPIKAETSGGVLVLRRTAHLQ